MNFLLDSIIVFVFIFLADIVWAKYIDTVGRGDRSRAANYSLLVYLFGAVGITAWMHDPWLLIPACVGAWFGTYYGMGDDGEI